MIFSKTKKINTKAKKGNEFYQFGAQAEFWRQAIMAFFIVLVVVIIAYVIVLSVFLFSPNRALPMTGANSSAGQIIDRKAIDKAVAEIKKRQQNFAQASSSASLLVDPSL